MWGILGVARGPRVITLYETRGERKLNVYIPFGTPPTVALTPPESLRLFLLYKRVYGLVPYLQRLRQGYNTGGVVFSFRSSAPCLQGGCHSNNIPPPPRVLNFLPEPTRALTHVRGHHPATVRRARWAQAWRKIFESPEALAESSRRWGCAQCRGQELHRCCARVSLAEALVRQDKALLTAWAGQGQGQ